MMAFPFFDTFQVVKTLPTPANQANHANPLSLISSISNISRPSLESPVLDDEDIQERIAIMLACSGDDQPAPEGIKTEYKLHHLKDNHPLNWCWFAVMEPGYEKGFANLCTLPPNEIYVSGHRTEKDALAYRSKEGF